VSRAEAGIAGGRPTAFWVGLGLKSSLLMLLLLPLLQPALEQYEGKGMSWRVLVYSLSCFIVPLLWRLSGSRPPYPYLADTLVVLPALTDVLWNTLGTYDRIWWWDSVNHLVNSSFAAVIGLWAARSSLGPVNRFALALGLGMTLQVVWELGEYATFLARSSVADQYADTIYDLSFDLVGSVVGAGFALLAANAFAREAATDEPAAAFTGS